MAHSVFSRQGNFANLQPLFHACGFKDGIGGMAGFTDLVDGDFVLAVGPDFMRAFGSSQKPSAIGSQQRLDRFFITVHA